MIKQLKNIGLSLILASYIGCGQQLGVKGTECEEITSLEEKLANVEEKIDSIPTEGINTDVDLETFNKDAYDRLKNDMGNYVIETAESAKISFELEGDKIFQKHGTKVEEDFAKETAALAADEKSKSLTEFIVNIGIERTSSLDKAKEQLDKWKTEYDNLFKTGKYTDQMRSFIDNAYQTIITDFLNAEYEQFTVRVDNMLDTKEIEFEGRLETKLTEYTNSATQVKDDMVDAYDVTLADKNTASLNSHNDDLADANDAALALHNTNLGNANTGSLDAYTLDLSNENSYALVAHGSDLVILNSDSIDQYIADITNANSDALGTHGSDVAVINFDSLQAYMTDVADESNNSLTAHQNSLVVINNASLSDYVTLVNTTNSNALSDHQTDLANANSTSLADYLARIKQAWPSEDPVTIVECTDGKQIVSKRFYNPDDTEIGFADIYSEDC